MAQKKRCSIGRKGSRSRAAISMGVRHLSASGEAHCTHRARPITTEKCGRPSAHKGLEDWPAGRARHSPTNFSWLRSQFNRARLHHWDCWVVDGRSGSLSVGWRLGGCFTWGALTARQPDISTLQRHARLFWEFVPIRAVEVGVRELGFGELNFVDADGRGAAVYPSVSA